MTSKSKLTKEQRAILDSIDEINPYASYMDDDTLSSVTNWIDTGSMPLNAIISGSLFGGVPDARVTQFLGPSQTAKSFIMMNLAANAQKQGKIVVIFDSENAIDGGSAQSVGLDTSLIKYVPSTNIESTKNAINTFMSKVQEYKQEGKYFVIIDSLANLVSTMDMKRADKNSDSADMGSFAKSVKALLKMCVAWSTLTRTAIVFTNHVYDDPSAMFPSLEKNISGGKGPIYLPSVNIQLARSPLNVEKDGGKTVNDKLAAGQTKFAGVVISAMTVKNRFIQPYLKCDFYISFSRGISKYFGLLELMKAMGVVVSNGPRYDDWNGNKLGFYKNFKDDSKLMDEVLIPELESRLKLNWSYSRVGDELNETSPEVYSEDIPDEDVPDEDIPNDQ